MGVIIYMKYTKEILEPIVKNSISMLEVIRKLELKQSGGTHRYMSKLIKNKFNIDCSHFKVTRTAPPFNKLQDDQILIKNRKNRKEPSKRLKNAMLGYGFVYQCAICGNDGKWQEKQLTLQIDHIDRDSLNNEPNNLRFLCPNCHSQTDTFAGKGNKKQKIKKVRVGKKKILWPEKETLKKLVWEKPTIQIAKSLGVSDAAISKWCRIYQITKPPRGYWAKQMARMARVELA